MDQTIRHDIRIRLRNHHWRKDFKGSVKTAARIAPLFGAILAPLSTLYDIPGVTQRWYTFNGIPVPDPPANLALSAIGLVFNAIANGLLILRFSSRQKWWKTVARLSASCWIIKAIIAVVNLTIYAAHSRNDPAYSYSDGFFAAAFSAGLSGLISILLLFSALVLQDEDHASDDIRVQARHFLLTELAFFLFIALEALAMSRLEDWSYFVGIYFATVTATTCGFGSDYAPATTAGRVLTFPFAVITIAGLAAQVSAIIDFFSARAQARKKQWREKYEERQEKVKDSQRPTDELIAEMQSLDKTIRDEDKLSRFWDLVMSLTAFITFWCIGAAIFSQIEGWTYGSSLYFCYVFFLTIGYGDFYPTTSCGRVFFVLFAIISVPIVASFAVQTISQILQAFQDKRLEREKVKRGIEPKLKKETTIPIQREKGYADDNDPEQDGVELEISPFISHAELVIRRHEQFRDPEQKPTSRDTRLGDANTTNLEETSSKSNPSSDGNQAGFEADGNGSPGADEKILAQSTDAIVSGVTDGCSNPRNIVIDEELLDELLIHSIHLESVARKLIIAGLDQSSKGRLLLQADTNLMQRAVALHHSDESESKVTHKPHVAKESELQQIHMYRESLARLLVTATRLRNLEGKQQLSWERRTGFPYKHGYPVKGEEITT